MESEHRPRCNARTTRSAAQLGGMLGSRRERQPARLVLGRRSRRTLESDFSILRSPRCRHLSEIPTTKNLSRTEIAWPETLVRLRKKTSAPRALLQESERWPHRLNSSVFGHKVSPSP